MAVQLENCIFCKIARSEASCEKIYEDDDVTCIKDIRPASKHHYLILPKKHISNAKAIKSEDSDLFEKMIVTIDVISRNLHLDPVSTITGFHWPPFNTVHHLHLHVIYPKEEMSYISRLIFRPNSYWFVSTDYVKSRLKKYQ